MPVAAQYPLSEVMEACDDYFAKTGRRITFEYSLIHGVNDTDEDAKLLSRLLAGKNCHVNLIPVNPVKSGILNSRTKIRRRLLKINLKK